MSYRGEDRGVEGRYSDLARRLRLVERVTSRAVSSLIFRSPLSLDPDLQEVSLAASGEPSASTFLRGDGVWAIPSSGGSSGRSAGLTLECIIFSLQAPTTVIGSWLPSAAAVLGGGVARTAATPDQEWIYADVALASGTWSVSLVHETSPVGGIAEVMFGDEVLLFDTYDAVGASDVRTTLSVPISGPCDITILNPDTNPLSTGNLLSLQALSLRRA